MDCLFNLSAKDYKSVEPVKLAMGQSSKKGKPKFNVQFNNDGFWADRQISFMTQEMKLILHIKT